MNIVDFSASADLVGRRARVAWTFALQGMETLAEIPQVALWRRTDDFAFADPPGYGDAATLVYDSAQFPPAPGPGVYVSDLPGWREQSDGLTTSYEAISVAGDFVVDKETIRMERLRRTRATSYDASGVAVSQRVEIVEIGDGPGALLPRVAYYYRLFAPPGAAADPPQAQTLIGDSFALGRWLYDQLPAVYRRGDVRTSPGVEGGELVPEAAPRGGQLRRLIDLFGLGADSLRSSADGLKLITDIDAAPASLLPRLAGAVGWDLEVDLPTAQLRNEIKSARRFYDIVGTVAGLRALVGRYTGWYAEIAEFYQNVARANQPSFNNLFAFVERAGAFSAARDAAPLLGFIDGKSANGAGKDPAALAGGAAEPFALAHGMTLDIRLGAGAPLRVVFGSADFVDIAKATAAEVAAAILAAAREVAPSAVAGKLILATRDTGPNAEIAVVSSEPSLFAFEGAPAGRPAAASDASGVTRVFYEAWRVAAAAAAQGDADSPAVRELRYKTWIAGAWRDALSAAPDAGTPRGDPAPSTLPDGRLLLGWIDNPNTPQSRLRIALGAPRPQQPATLLGARGGPFALVAGAKLTLTGGFPGADVFVVNAPDFAHPAAATASEALAAINAQLTHVKASLAANGALRLATLAAGPTAALAVDLAHSTAAYALGFAQTGSTAATGGFDPAIDWSAAATALWPGLPPGRWADLATEPTGGSEGGARLAVAGHVAGLWRVFALRFDERALAATGTGLNLLSGGVWTKVDAAAGLPSNDVRAAVLDEAGQVWVATAAGAALRAVNGAIAVFNQSGGLPSNDVRALALGPDGAAWFATAAGVGLRRPDGTIAQLGLADGLPSLDVRDVVASPGGEVWFATAAGLARRSRAGDLAHFALPASLPSATVAALALGPDDALLAAGPGFTALVTDKTILTRVEADGSPAADIRAVAFDAGGLPLVGSARGVTRLSADLSTATGVFDTGAGLAGHDIRALAPGPDGRIWVASAAGIDLLDINAGVAAPLDPAPPFNDVRRIGGWRAAPLELSSGLEANREPCLARDGQGRLWAIWSQRQPGEDCWTLTARIFAPGAGWGGAFAITQPPAGGRAADRLPAALASGAAGMRIVFASDRGGGTRLHQTVSPAGGPGSAPAAVSALAQGSVETSPALAVVGGQTWLIARADENVALARSAPPPPPPAPSYRAPEATALRRVAGALTSRVDDVARRGRARVFGDLMSYTPQKPLGPLEPPLQDDDFYTPATIGLYVSNPIANEPITAAEAGRLRDLLTRFLPINRRAVVIINPTTASEVVYADGQTIAESWIDEYPFADALTGLADATAVTLSGWTVLHANTPGDVSASFADATTLRKRSFFPPPL